VSERASVGVDVVWYGY